MKKSQVIKELKNPCTKEYLDLKKYIHSPDMAWYYIPTTTYNGPNLHQVEHQMKDALKEKTNLNVDQADKGLLDIPYYSHALMVRPDRDGGKLYTEITSSLFESTYEVLKQIFKYNDINPSVIYRLNFNVTFSSKNKRSAYHRDLIDLPHKNLIIYMSKFSGGETYIKDGTREIIYTPKEDEIILFDGDLDHCNAVPSEDERRIVMVANIYENTE